MADYAEADARLMDWLAERTDTQLQRLLDAPEDGLTNDHFMIWEKDGGCQSCLLGWAGDNRIGGKCDIEDIPKRESTAILRLYGLWEGDGLARPSLFRRIQGFAAAELVVRRVERKALPPAREVVTA